MTSTPSAPLPVRLAKLRCLKSIASGPVRYELRLIDCYNPRCLKCHPDLTKKRHATHGPYWYLITQIKTTKQKITAYIGKELDTNKFRTPEGEFDNDLYQEHLHRAKTTPAEKTPGATTTVPATAKKEY